MILRRCTVCGLTARTEEDLGKFIRADRGKHGRRNICRACWNKRQQGGWSSRGLKADVNREQLQGRRMEVIRLIEDGYKPTHIGKTLGVHTATIQGDLGWLKDNGYLDKDFAFRRRFQPTYEMTIEMATMLRTLKPITIIAKAMDTTPASISNFLKREPQSPIIRKALRDREFAKEREARKVAPPSKTKREAAGFLKQFGCTLEEWSDSNVLWLYKTSHRKSLTTLFLAKIYKMQKRGVKPHPKWVEYWENQGLQHRVLL